MGAWVAGLMMVVVKKGTWTPVDYESNGARC
jgi:hypothetical protein